MTDTEIAKRIAELPLEKRALLFQQLQKQREKETAAEPQRIPRQARDRETYPLSFAQQRLWFLNNFEPESPEYNIPQAFRIEGDLDPEVMQRALREVARRHEALRTTFRSIEGEPAQVVAQVVDMEVPFTDARARVSEPADAWAEALRLAAADAREPFDLTLGPLMRARLYRTGEREHLLYYNVHHIAYDGWSIGVFTRELAAIYDAFAAGLPSPLPPLPVQYLDFALWQRQWLSGETLETQLAYWRRQLASVPPLELATDRPRPAVRTHNRRRPPSPGGAHPQRRRRAAGAGRGPAARPPHLRPARGVDPLHRADGRLQGPPAPLDDPGGRLRGHPDRQPAAARGGGDDRLLRQQPGAARRPVRRSELPRAAAPRARGLAGRLRPPGPPLRKAGRGAQPAARHGAHAALPGDADPAQRAGGGDGPAGAQAAAGGDRQPYLQGGADGLPD